MKAMILAAGRGERMRPLTDHTPKPLLLVGGQPLIVWHLRRLAAAGIHDVVINHAWLGEQIEATLGDGKSWGVCIQYSPEQTALETAGGIANALPLLGADPFLVLNGDVWCDWPLERALGWFGQSPSPTDPLAHLVLVPNPSHHPEGDFSIGPQGRLSPHRPPLLTYAGLGVFYPELFAGIARHEPSALAPLLKHAMAQGRVTGERHAGQWMDIGTVERLSALEQQLR